jgi:hypothetical protein
MISLSGGRLEFIYRISPLQILSQKGSAFELETVAGDPRFEGWSGSSQFADYDGKSLCVVHRHHDEEKGRIYEHVFLELDGRKIVRASQPWHFEQDTIEFCSSLCIRGDEAIIGYGYRDYEAMLLRMPLRMIEMMLRPGPIPRMLMAGFGAAGECKARWRPARTVELAA